MGDDCALAGNPPCQSSLPVSTSNARNTSSIAAAMKTMPFVIAEPPRLGEPMFGGSPGIGVTLPKGVSHRTVPRSTSIAVSAPHGGGVHGTPFGDRRIVRYIA